LPIDVLVQYGYATANAYIAGEIRIIAQTFVYAMMSTSNYER
jgi:hypothetical protein